MSLMRNRVHKERHALKKNTAMIGENQSCRVKTEAGRKRARLLRPASRHDAARPQDGSSHHTCTDNNSLIKTTHSSPISPPITVQLAAGRRHLSAVLHAFGGRFGTAGEATLHARRFPSNALSQDDSDQMCLPLELLCFLFAQC